MLELVFLVIFIKFIDSTTTVFRLYNLRQKNYKKIFFFSLITEATWMLAFYYATKDDNLILMITFIITRVVANYIALNLLNNSNTDYVSIKIVTSKKVTLLNELEKYNIKPVILDVHGHHKNKNLFYVTVSKRNLKKRINTIKEIDSNAFITVSNILEIG